MRPLKRQQGTWHIKCSPNHLPLADLADASVFGYVSRLNKLKMLKQLVLDQVRTQLANMFISLRRPGPMFLGGVF